MYRIDGPTRAAALPAPLPVGTGSSSPGYFAHGDLLAGVPYTTLDPDWCNAIQEEIAGVVEAAEIDLDKANHGQLLAALQSLFVLQGAGAGVIVGTNEASIPLAGGFILKVGNQAGTYSEGALTHVFDNPFPNACWAVIPVSINTSATVNKDIWPQRQSRSATGFTLFLNLGGGTTTNSIDGVDYIAVGN